MKFTYIGVDVTGFNRTALDGEQEGNFILADVPWGMDVEMYIMIGSALTPKTQAEVDAILAAREVVAEEEKAKDKKIKDAKDADFSSLNEAIEFIEANVSDKGIQDVFKRIVPFTING